MGSGMKRRVRAAQRLNRILSAVPPTAPSQQPAPQLTPAQARLEAALEKVGFIRQQLSLYRERYESLRTEQNLVDELAKLQTDEDVSQALASYAECQGRYSEALENAVETLEDIERRPPVPDVQTAVSPEAVDEVLAAAEAQS